MKTVIISPKNEILKRYVQYFLFFKKDDGYFLNYTTFPNVNFCLALYKENSISYESKNINLCKITNGGSIKSRFYGFHKMPFRVDINSSLDQICVIFRPSAIRAFTKESYDDLMDSEGIFEELFASDKYLLEKIFEINELDKRAAQLEHLLLKNLQNDISEKMKETLMLINKKNIFSIDLLSKELKISEATLFRLFKNNLGQNPKSYLKTRRFRNVLNDILKPESSLTDLAYKNHYFDQAHFINDFKTLAGSSPKKLVQKISVDQDNLTWIYNKGQN
jgi:AraC-like DNA-binding protein